MKKEQSEQEAYAWAASRCATTEYCEADLEQKLLNKGLTLAMAHRVIEQLVKENFINEARYCRAFTNDKIRYAHWGRLKIKQAFCLKGANPRCYEAALQEIDEEEYTSLLHSVLLSKMRTIKAANHYERRGKLIRFALGRGFEMDFVIKEVDHLVTSYEEED
ncbi:MAG: regulatory protein RecX [Bacteroidaceae bacterium]